MKRIDVFQINISFLFMLLFVFASYGRKEAGLILSGIDTLLDDAQHNEMDFVLQRPCTSATKDPGCNAHFGIEYSSPWYVAALTGQGLVLDKGKMNLDSIKSAPPDSQMKDDLGLGQPYMIFRIAPDSLKKCIGNCYILKTGVDPRRGNSMYAKIKILGFTTIDSANHNIKMNFLWAYNDNGFHDLTTSSLDTFRLDTPTLSLPSSQLARNANHSLNNQYVFKVVGDKFILPKELVGKFEKITVYNLEGKKLGQIQCSMFSNRHSLSKAIRKMGEGTLVLLGER